MGNELIWESRYEKLLGLTIDKNLNFNQHLSIICKEVSAKVSALAKMVKIIPFEKKRFIMKSFIESKFSYCPLIWMFCSRKMNRKINHIHERALRLVYEDYVTSFEDLLVKDKTVSIHHRNIQKVAIEMFKVKNDLCPTFIKNLFCQIQTRTRSNASFGEQSIRSIGPIVWDSMLPGNLKTITSLEEFKQKISEWVPKNCACRLCKKYVQNLGFVSVQE